MNFLTDIFAGGAEGIFNGVRNIISTVKADPLEVLKLEQAMHKAEMELTLGLSQAQTKINEIEAGSGDKFVSRWRPACGWIGVTGLGYATIFHPIASWICLNNGLVVPPQLDTIILMELVTGLLGLAGMRSYDKMMKK